ncbi:MAG: type II toxin-antitoxin system death-on-curing family toxin [Thaumarchaeota archaeon]|nr:type II toxin-antitoxin system death-on-curing family toxin [Nitrososphaerota archaeon]MDE1839303.1 type II toxin-antitoxin system death-on-curing family toxin [Nitrososphaerota archaeon]
MEDLTAEDLLDLHNVVEEKFKVFTGVKDLGLVKAISERPNQVLYGKFTPFDNVFTKAASLMEGIIRMHPFYDGNKRTALLATIAYLQLNGYIMAIPLSAVRFTVKIARYEKNDPESTAKLILKIAKWLEKLSAKSDNPSEVARKSLFYFLIPIILLIPVSVISLGWIGKLVLGRWMAFDMYPEYRQESGKIFSFIIETTRKSLKKDAFVKRKNSE